MYIFFNTIKVIDFMLPYLCIKPFIDFSLMPDTIHVEVIHFNKSTAFSNNGSAFPCEATFSTNIFDAEAPDVRV